MRREIYFDMAMERTKKYVFGNQGTGLRVVATGFWSGYYHTKVNAEEKNKSPTPVVIEWLYMCAGAFHNGSAAILISLFGASKL